MNRHLPQKLSAWLVAIGFLLTLAFSVILFASIDANRSRPLSAATTVPSSPTAVMTAWFDSPYIRPELREWYKGLPPDKQEFWRLEEQRRLADLLATRDPNAIKPPINTPGLVVTANIVRRPAGAGTIADDIMPPFSSDFYVHRNMWEETVAGKRTIIFAGGIKDVPSSAGENASQGVITSWPDGGSYLTPVKAGPVRITDALGERLVLTADTGVTFYFDVPSRQFVSSLTEPIPTISATASPSATMTPTRRPYP